MTQRNVRGELKFARSRDVNDKTKKTVRDDDNGGSSDRRRIPKVIKEDLLGTFAKDALFKVTPFSPDTNLIINLKYLEKVIIFLDDENTPIKVAFDLKTKRVHFFIRKDPKEFDDYSFLNVTNDDEKLLDIEQVSPLIRLNIDKEYVAQNLMVDIKGCERLTERTQIPSDAIFVDYKYVHN